MQEKCKIACRQYNIELVGGDTKIKKNLLGSEPCPYIGELDHVKIRCGGTNKTQRSITYFT